MQTCAVIRPGAFGDVLQASSVFPWLHAQGCRVSLYTSAQGEEACRHDPHLASIVVLPRQAEAPASWQAIEADHDQTINLVHASEHRLLFKPSQHEFWWPDAQRRRAVAGRSYLGEVHALAGVPGPYRMRFYPSADESQWARTKRAAWPGLIMISLRGSAPYKEHPRLTEVVCRVLAATDAAVVLVGDLGARPIESSVLDAVTRYTDDGARVFSLVGDKQIRFSLALAQQADVVVGPETGLLNAVGLEDGVAKVVLLSHSSAHGLVDGWRRVTALSGDAPCAPCHRLHEHVSTCPQVDGAAACQAALRPSVVAQAVVSAYASRRTLAAVGAA